MAVVERADGGQVGSGSVGVGGEVTAEHILEVEWNMMMPVAMLAVWRRERWWPMTAERRVMVEMGAGKVRSSSSPRMEREVASCLDQVWRASCAAGLSRARRDRLPSGICGVIPEAHCSSQRVTGRGERSVLQSVALLE